MLNKKFIWVISVLAVGTVILIYFLIGIKERELSPVINAIPPNSAFIIETDDLSFLSHKILKNNNLINFISEPDFSNDFYNELIYIDSLISKNSDIKKFLNEKSVLISAHLQGQSDLDFLFATSSTENNKNSNKLKSLLKNLDPDSKSSDISFAGAELVRHQFSNNRVLFYTFYEDFFLISYSEILIQKSVKNINSGASLFSDINFTKLYKQTSNKNDAVLYLNYHDLFNAFDKYFSSEYRNELKTLKNLADWTVLDISIKRKEIKMTGHTTLKSEVQYLDLFKDVNPERIDLFTVLPEKTSSLIQLNIGNGNDFQFKYEDFLANINELNDHQIEIASFYNKYDLDKDVNSLYNLVGNEIALVFEDINKTGKKHNSYIIFEVNSKKDTEEFFYNIIEKHCSDNNSDLKEYKDFIIYNDEYKISKIPATNLPELYFGSVFSNFNAEYITFINDFLVFGESKNELKYIIESYTQDKTFKRKSDSYDFIKSLPGQSNIFFFTDIFRSVNIYENILSEKSFENLSNNSNAFKPLQGPAIQFISDSYPIYTTVTISLERDERETTETEWEVRLDTMIASKPYVLINHNTEEKEIAIQDAANKLYLIDKSGKVIWTRQLDGKIISEILQIDFFENNKLQIIFNTENKIYCIDRNGNWVEGFPVKLKSMATGGLSLVDYDKNKNYRIFIATKDNSVHLYDKYGNIVEGWEFKKTSSKVIKEIKLYQSNEKDYITFRDHSKIYILNRRGTERVKPEVDFQLSENSKVFFSHPNQLFKAHFCITNPSGVVYKIFEDGKIEKKELKKYSNKHHFIYADINNDGIHDYIFTDNNRTEAFNGSDDKRLFIKNYNKDLTYEPSLYIFSNADVRIGTGSENKIFLINNKGEMSDNFPLIGSGLFSITIFDDSGEFSLIVGNNDNYLYKYKIK